MKKGFFKTILTKGGTLFVIGVLWTLCILVKAFYCERSNKSFTKPFRITKACMPTSTKAVYSKIAIWSLNFSYL